MWQHHVQLFPSLSPTVHVSLASVFLTTPTSTTRSHSSWLRPKATQRSFFTHWPVHQPSTCPVDHLSAAGRAAQTQMLQGTTLARPRAVCTTCSCSLVRPQHTRPAARRPGRSSSRSSAAGRQLGTAASNGSKWTMARWLENKASLEVPAPLEVCWSLWEDRTLIPTWMPWIKSVTVLDSDPRLSKWTLSTNQFGRDWEFSWLARNLAPIKNQKIHWVSEPGSASMGISVDNRGQIRFVRRGPAACEVTITISYEVPDVLAPFASALTPVVEGVMAQDMVRFKDIAVAKAQRLQQQRQQQQVPQ